MTYTLTIRSEGHSAVPEAVRLRHVLRRLLRTYAFRCERIAPVAAGAQACEQDDGRDKSPSDAQDVPQSQPIDLSDTSAGECRQQHKPNTGHAGE